MEEQEKKNVTEETENKETKEPEKKEEKTAESGEKEAKKAEKAKKASLGKRAKSAIVRNKKPIIAAVVGFVSGVGATIGGSMWLGHRHRKQEEEAMRSMVPQPAEDYSPLDPNVE